MLLRVGCRARLSRGGALGDGLPAVASQARGDVAVRDGARDLRGRLASGAGCRRLEVRSQYRGRVAVVEMLRVRLRREVARCGLANLRRLPACGGSAPGIRGVNLPGVGRVYAVPAAARRKAQGRAQFVNELARGLRSVGAILRHRVRDPAAEGFGHAGRDLRERRQRRGHVLVPKLGERAPAQGLPTGDQLEEDYS